MRFGWAATALIYHERPRISTNDLSHGALSPCAIVRRALRLPPLVAGLLLVNQMNRAILDLAAALRERLAIISDESSRRDPEAHTARLQAISEKIEKLAAAMPKQSIRSSPTFSGAKATTKPWNSWKTTAFKERV